MGEGSAQNHRPQPVEFLFGCLFLVRQRLEVGLHLHLCDINHFSVLCCRVCSLAARGAIVDGVLAVVNLRKLVHVVGVVFDVGDVEGCGQSGDTEAEKECLAEERHSIDLVGFAFLKSCLKDNLSD